MYCTLTRIHSFFCLGRLLVASLGLILFANFAAYAQAPDWQTVAATTQASGTRSFVFGSAADASGNVYVTGNFTGTVAFGNITLTSAGSTDLFVAKWSSSSRSFVWAQRAGGTSLELSRAIAVSGSSVYITGWFNSSSIDFGTTALTNTGTANAADMFVAKLTDNGSSATFSWAQQASGTGADQGQSVAVSGTSVYVVGSYDSSTLQVGTTTLVKTGNAFNGDIFITKLTDAGSSASFVWTQGPGGEAEDYAEAVAVSGTSVYVTGYFNSPSLSFGNTTLTNTSTDAFETDIFVVKLTDAGNTSHYDWAQQGGGTDSEQAYAVAVNGANVYVTGNFRGRTATFGTTTLTGAGNYDLFVAKLTDAGSTSSFTWAAQAGGPAADSGIALAVSGTNIFVTGDYESATARFGATTLTRVGISDIFLTKLVDGGGSGSFAWAKQAGGVGDDRAYGVSTSGTNVYVAGSITLPATFGSLTLTGSTSNATGFVASLTDLALPTRKAAQLAELHLYPNPAHTNTTLQLPVNFRGAEAILTFRDGVGRVVRTQSVHVASSSTTVTVSILGLTPGFYQVQVQTGTQFMNSPLVVE